MKYQLRKVSYDKKTVINLLQRKKVSIFTSENSEKKIQRF
jgi:hypothetical protein